MAMEGVICGAPYTYVSAGSLTANAIVTLTTSGTVNLCGSGGTPIGVIYEAYSSGDTVTVYPLTGRHLLTSTGTITAADFVKPGASGAVAPEAGVTTRTADTCGQAETTVSGAGLFWAVLNC